MSDLQIPDRTERQACEQIAEARLRKLLFTINWHKAFLKGMADEGASIVHLGGHASVAMAEIIKDFDSYTQVKK